MLEDSSIALPRGGLRRFFLHAVAAIYCSNGGFLVAADNSSVFRNVSSSALVLAYLLTGLVPPSDLFAAE
jgi:hypothetical protein